VSVRPWKKLSESTLFANSFWQYRRDEFELPSGKRGEYHYVHTNGSALTVPVADDGRILMIQQYRYLVARNSIEFPCGGAERNDSLEATARRELMEETGYEAETWSHVGHLCPMNGLADELCEVWVARGLHWVGARPDETEEFELLSLSLDEIDALVRDGSIWDGMSLAGWCMVRAAHLL
jgi:ADP-ribose pyrophosphatase